MPNSPTPSGIYSSAGRAGDEQADLADCAAQSLVRVGKEGGNFGILPTKTGSRCPIVRNKDGLENRKFASKTSTSNSNLFSV